MRVADMMAKAIQLSLCPRRRVSERRVGEMPRQARKAGIRAVRQPPPVLRGAVIESRRLGGCVRPRAERFGRCRLESVQPGPSARIQYPTTYYEYCERYQNNRNSRIAMERDPSNIYARSLEPLLVLSVEFIHFFLQTLELLTPILNVSIHAVALLTPILDLSIPTLALSIHTLALLTPFFTVLKPALRIVSPPAFAFFVPILDLFFASAVIFAPDRFLRFTVTFFSVPARFLRFALTVFSEPAIFAFLAHKVFSIPALIFALALFNSSILFSVPALIFALALFG